MADLPLDRAEIVPSFTNVGSMCSDLGRYRQEGLEEEWQLTNAGA